MNRDEVITTAREAGFAGAFDVPISELAKFERFAAIVEARAAEREREACVEDVFVACFDLREAVRVRETIRARSNEGVDHG